MASQVPNSLSILSLIFLESTQKRICFGLTITALATIRILFLHLGCLASSLVRIFPQMICPDLPFTYFSRALESFLSLGLGSTIGRASEPWSGRCGLGWARPVSMSQPAAW